MVASAASFPIPIKAVISTEVAALRCSGEACICTCSRTSQESQRRDAMERPASALASGLRKGPSSGRPFFSSLSSASYRRRLVPASRRTALTSELRHSPSSGRRAPFLFIPLKRVLPAATGPSSATYCTHFRTPPQSQLRAPFLFIPLKRVLPAATAHRAKSRRATPDTPAKAISPHPKCRCRLKRQAPNPLKPATRIAPIALIGLPHQSLQPFRKICAGAGSRPRHVPGPGFHPFCHANFGTLAPSTVCGNFCGSRNPCPENQPFSPLLPAKCLQVHSCNWCRCSSYHPQSRNFPENRPIQSVTTLKDEVSTVRHFSTVNPRLTVPPTSATPAQLAASPRPPSAPPETPPAEYPLCQSASSVSCPLFASPAASASG